jgi:archaellum component FlaC
LDKTQAANGFQSMLHEVNEKLVTIEGQLGAVHRSWQGQTQVIASKDAEVAELQGRVDELSECVNTRNMELAAISQAFRNETKKRQKSEAILDLIQMEHIK